MRKRRLSLSVLVLGPILFMAATSASNAIEEPPFTLTLTRDGFEVREYPALLAAEVTVSGDRDTAANAVLPLTARSTR